MPLSIFHRDVHEVVHVIPLGLEIDRAAAPFEAGLVANRARVLTILNVKRDADWNLQQQTYLRAVQARLKACRVRAVVEDVDTFDLQALMSAVSRIILEERAAKNDVFVNISAAGKLQAVAASLAAMAHGAKIYYVEAEEYAVSKREREEHGLSKSAGKVRHLVNVPFALPNERGMRVLVELAARPEALSTEDLLESLRRAGFEGFGSSGKGTRSERTNYLMKLNKGVLEPLEKAGYLTHRERVGRNKLTRATEAGRLIASLSGLTPVLKPKAPRR